MSEDILSQIKLAVKEGINGQLIAVHQQIASNEEKRIADHKQVTEQIKILSDKVAPFDTTRTWVKQLINGLKYLGVPAAALYGIIHLINSFR